MAALTTDDILREEANAIHGTVLAASIGGQALHHALNQLGSAALCLSGGGIRSAAFSLGVIQALAAHQRTSDGAQPARAEDSLLTEFHYLSSVSGGGYIGAWLTAWRARTDFATIWRNLVGRPGGANIEPSMIAWLRGYSNYLTPKHGFISADVWTAGALVIRNLLLNWLIILPFMCAVILLLKIMAVGSDWVNRMSDWWLLQISIGGVGVACMIMAIAFMTRHRPSRRAAKGNAALSSPGPDQVAFLRHGLLWSVLSAVFIAQFLGSDLVGGNLLAHWGADECKPWGEGPSGQLCKTDSELLVPLLSKGAFAALGGLVGVVIYAAGWLVSLPKKHDLHDFLIWSVSGFAYGAVVGFGLYLYLQVPEDGVWIFSSVVLPMVFGIPWILIAQLIAETIFVGLSSYGPQSESDREWLARAGGWTLVTALGWFAVMFLAFFGAIIIWDDGVWEAVAKWIAPLGGLSGLLTALLGSSSLSRATGAANGIKSFSANLVLSIAAPIFAAVLIISLSVGLDALLLGKALVPDRFNDWTGDPADRLITLGWLAGGLLALTAIGVIASRFINVNRFSLHALYRNRLIRAFLGATRQRQPDSFTGFDEGDNPLMRDLWPSAAAGVPTSGWRPFHVVNATLNIVAAKKLAWQQRKAAPFSITPLHCGSASKCNPGEANAVGAFRASHDYAEGITLGTAMAISGAAASPNMGYHSSPGVTFLMSLFNVRLGWWLGNPSDEKSFKRQGPLIAILPLLRETFGLTTDDQKYIYLSDGGHFENLGLYEMVRRRCRTMVVVDAGCDGRFEFDDLGNAVRKIALDLGIEVEFSGLSNLWTRGAGDAPGELRTYAIGNVRYQAADGADVDGIILYVKPAYHGTEKNTGVRNYAAVNRAFPHEATTDQWFSESQFESYRALGFEIMDGILRLGEQRVKSQGSHSLNALIQALP